MHDEWILTSQNFQNFTKIFVPGISEILLLFRYNDIFELSVKFVTWKFQNLKSNLLGLLSSISDIEMMIGSNLRQTSEKSLNC